jgi:hypothetical protein
MLQAGIILSDNLFRGYSGEAVSTLLTVYGDSLDKFRANVTCGGMAIRAFRQKKRRPSAATECF